jgi:hypothetical protein
MTSPALRFGRPAHTGCASVRRLSEERLLQRPTPTTTTSDNPISNKDPSGRAVGADDAIAFGVGGVINMAAYGIGNSTTGQPLTLGGFSGAFITGGIVGWGMENAPMTGGASIAASMAAMKYAAKVGAVAGPIGNFAKQAIDVKTGAQSEGFSWGEFAMSPVQGASTAALAEGALPVARIPGLSAGRGNWNGVGNWAKSSIRNGTIQNTSISTSFKSSIGAQAANSYKTFGGAAWDGGTAKMGNAVSTWMGAFNPFVPQK